MDRQLFHYQLLVPGKNIRIVLGVYTDKVGLITDRVDADKKADAASKQLEVILKKLPTKRKPKKQPHASNKDVSLYSDVQNAKQRAPYLPEGRFLFSLY